MNFTDSHCHLDFSEFTHSEGSLLQLLKQCHNNRIHNIIVPSVSPDNWQTVLNLPSLYPQANVKIHPCLGIHPWYLFHENTALNQDSLIDLAQLCDNNKERICAIGETGIDTKIAEQYDNLAQQREFFAFHLELANTLSKPVIVHHRKSHQYIIPLLKQFKPKKQGVIHAFSGSYQEAKQYIDLGFKLGIGGTITYPRAKKTIETIKKLPLKAILLETDAPSMPLNGYQGENNSPVRILEVFKALCVLRKESNEHIAKAIEHNVNELFNLQKK